MSGWQVPVQGGSGKSGLGHDFPDGNAFVPQHDRVFELVRVNGGRSAGLPTMGSCYRPGVRGAFGGVGAFHLREQRQHDHGQLRHWSVRVGSVNAQGIGKRADSDAAFLQLVDQVQGVPNRPAQPVQSVHHDHISWPRLA